MPLTVTIPISDEIINIHKRTIVKDSIKEELFIKDIINSTKSLDMSNLLDILSLEKAINDLAKDINNMWTKNSKLTNITKHSKSWWDDNCNRDLKRYKSLKSLKN